jgi:hypothetical protein
VWRRRHGWFVFLAVLTTVGSVSASSAGAAQPRDPFAEICPMWSTGYRAAPGPVYPETKFADRCLRLNQIQVIGSHNSFHVQPREPLWSEVRSRHPRIAGEIEYTHSPLGVQFDDEEVRQIELDVFADPAGGLYDQRTKILPQLGLPADSGIPELEQPGFKVLHFPEFDFETTCWTLVECLGEVKLFHQAHPRHLPIAILVELKDETIGDPLNLGVHGQPIGPAELDALDAEIRSVFPEQQLLTPEEVRGSHPTLEDAILTDGWPTLGAARGQVMFLMLAQDGRQRLDYLAGHPNLDGRVMFTSSNEGEPDAAFLQRDPDVFAIQDLVRRGYLVRTPADSGTKQARTGDTTQRDAALLSGAQFVSTDYPVPGRAAPLGTDYVAQIPDGDPARCNPINTGPDCRNDALERLH